MVIKRRGAGSNHLEYHATGAMKGLVALLILALVTSNITPLFGLPMEYIFTHVGRCKCKKYTSAVIGPKQLKSIQVIPKGMHCRRTEVIITVKQNWKICVNPTAEWVDQLLKQLTKRKSSK